MQICGRTVYGHFVDATKEVTIDCSIEQISRLIKFLQYVEKEFLEYSNIDESLHLHYRDWDTNWQIGTSDLIINTYFGNEYTKPIWSKIRQLLIDWKPFNTNYITNNDDYDIVNFIFFTLKFYKYKNADETGKHIYINLRKMFGKENVNKSNEECIHFAESLQPLKSQIKDDC